MRSQQWTRNCGGVKLVCGEVVVLRTCRLSDDQNNSLRHTKHFATSILVSSAITSTEFHHLTIFPYCYIPFLSIKPASINTNNNAHRSLH
jgi:hypothetical protein